MTTIKKVSSLSVSISPVGTKGDLHSVSPGGVNGVSGTGGNGGNGGNGFSLPGLRMTSEVSAPKQQQQQHPISGVSNSSIPGLHSSVLASAAFATMKPRLSEIGAQRRISKGGDMAAARASAGTGVSDPTSPDIPTTHTQHQPTNPPAHRPTDIRFPTATRQAPGE